MVTCWSRKGGAGTTTVAAGISRAVAGRGEACLVVDLAGDLPAAFGAVAAPGPGIAEWTAAGGAVPADALDRLAVAVAERIRLLPRGHGPLDLDRLGVLATLVARRGGQVVVDAGCPPVDARWAGAPFAAASDRSLLVVRACPLGLAELGRASAPAPATGLVVVRDPGRATPLDHLARAAGAPVLVELDLDPAVGAAADQGLARAPLPRAFVRALGTLA